MLHEWIWVDSLAYKFESVGLVWHKFLYGWDVKLFCSCILKVGSGNLKVNQCWKFLFNLDVLKSSDFSSEANTESDMNA